MTPAAATRSLPCPCSLPRSHSMTGRSAWRFQSRATLATSSPRAKWPAAPRPPSCSSMESARHTATCAGCTGSCRVDGDLYFIDLPGFGATPRPGNQLSIADHARYILGAMEQLDVPELVLVGHSMGTQLAMEAALQEPEQISNVVLMGPVVDPGADRGTRPWRWPVTACSTRALPQRPGFHRLPALRSLWYSKPCRS